MRFSRLAGGFRIGPEWLDPHRSPRDAHGVVDRIADLAHPGIDVTAIDPAIVRFFERTDSLDLRIESRWRFPFSIAWWLFRPLLRLVGQFVLPVRHGRIRTRAFGLDPARDGRADVRAVIRTYADTGEVMQVVAYATSTEGEARYMNAAFPLPLGHLTGILRLDRDGEGVVLTSERRGDHPGVWLVIFGVPLRLPLGERLHLWAEDGALRGRHEQFLFGIKLVEHRYWFAVLS